MKSEKKPSFFKKLAIIIISEEYGVCKENWHKLKYVINI